MNINLYYPKIRYKHFINFKTFNLYKKCIQYNYNKKTTTIKLKLKHKSQFSKIVVFWYSC